MTLRDAWCIAAVVSAKIRRAVRRFFRPLTDFCDKRRDADWIGDYCADCNALHPADQCPRAIEADCAECVGVVPLTPAGWCVNGRYHTIANRRVRVTRNAP